MFERLKIIQENMLFYRQRAERLEWERNKALEEKAKKQTIINELQDALEKIAYSVRYMQEKAEEQGCQLDGVMATKLANDPNWLKNAAKQALVKIRL